MQNLFSEMRKNLEQHLSSLVVIKILLPQSKNFLWYQSLLDLESFHHP